MLLGDERGLRGPLFAGAHTPESVITRVERDAYPATARGTGNTLRHVRAWLVFFSDFFSLGARRNSPAGGRDKSRTRAAPLGLVGVQWLEKFYGWSSQRKRDGWEGERNKGFIAVASWPVLFSALADRGGNFPFTYCPAKVPFPQTRIFPNIGRRRELAGAVRRER